MLKPLVTHFLQHLTRQNQWSRAYLAPFAGKVVCFDFSVTQSQLCILEDGSLCIAGETRAPDATVHIPPSLAMRLLANDDSAKSHIKIDGDTHLATEVSKVLQGMRWDVEDDLSKVVGDVAAYKIGGFSKQAFAEARQQTTNVAEMLTEFWQEEVPLLAKKRHVEQFNHDVDTLKSDLARVEKRLEKVLRKIGASQSTSPESNGK
jgi:ubiquinone biosynthesis accessory factor UbiJ